VRPAQSSQILPTRQLVGKPGPKFLIRPRIVTPTDRTPTVSHVHTLLHSSGYAGRMFEGCMDRIRRRTPQANDYRYGRHTPSADDRKPVVCSDFRQCDQCCQGGEDLRNQPVVRPLATLLAGEDAGIDQDLEAMGNHWLGESDGV
jgi:hypothetical protein